jgi:hypothetical protein
MRRLASAGLVGAPWGKRRSKVVNIVRSFAIFGEQPNVLDQTLYMWRGVMLGKHCLTSSVTRSFAPWWQPAFPKMVLLFTAPKICSGINIGESNSELMRDCNATNSPVGRSIGRGFFGSFFENHLDLAARSNGS